MTVARLDITLLWIPTTLFAAGLQTARNAMQHSLTAAIGTVGATQVQFLYGFPFSLIFLAVITAATGESLPRTNGEFWAFVIGGAVAQIVATGMMLAAMRVRSFASTIAFTKTEPVQVAIFGIIVLGDHLPLLGAVAIVIATVGVVVLSWKREGPSDG